MFTGIGGTKKRLSVHHDRANLHPLVNDINPYNVFRSREASYSQGMMFLLMKVLYNRSIQLYTRSSFCHMSKFLAITISYFLFKFYFLNTQYFPQACTTQIKVFVFMCLSTQSASFLHHMLDAIFGNATNHFIKLQLVSFLRGWKKRSLEMLILNLQKHENRVCTERVSNCIRNSPLLNTVSNIQE